MSFIRLIGRFQEGQRVRKPKLGGLPDLFHASRAALPLIVVVLVFI